MKTIECRLSLRASDGALEEGFAWAKAHSLSLVSLGDPVGDWYEAAIPGRDSFCLRDLCHQSAGARLLGLQAITLNMFRAFARNICAGRDWCTYWEIDKRGLPCSADYRDDTCFWYNLPANFDLVRACCREYLWTGNRVYLEDPLFRYFNEATLTGYVEAWDRDRDGIPEHHPEDGTRGLGTYSEGTQGKKALMGGDLIALYYAACLARATALDDDENGAEAERCRSRAADLKHRYNEEWWDEARGAFHSIMLLDRTFSDEYIPESQVFPLLCGIIEEGRKTDRTLEASIGKKRPNIEIRSYLPEAWYQYGRNDAAYEEILAQMKPDLEGRNYPELAFSLVASVAVGMMGLDADVREHLVTTQPRTTGGVAWADLSGVPVFRNIVRVRHEGTTQSELENTSGPPLYWKAAFPGTMETLVVDGRETPARTGMAVNGQRISWVVLPLERGAGHKVTTLLR